MSMLFIKKEQKMETKNIITIIVCLVVGVFLYDIFVFGNNDILSSEIFGDAECEIIYFVNCEILLLRRNMK